MVDLILDKNALLLEKQSVGFLQKVFKSILWRDGNAKELW
jgi:hypothetical protein